MITKFERTAAIISFFLAVFFVQQVMIAPKYGHAELDDDAGQL